MCELGQECTSGASHGGVCTHCEWDRPWWSVHTLGVGQAMVECAHTVSGMECAHTVSGKVVLTQTARYCQEVHQTPWWYVHTTKTSGGSSTCSQF